MAKPNSVDGRMANNSVDKHYADLLEQNVVLRSFKNIWRDGSDLLSEASVPTIIKFYDGKLFRIEYRVVVMLGIVDEDKWLYHPQFFSDDIREVMYGTKDLRKTGIWCTSEDLVEVLEEMLLQEVRFGDVLRECIVRIEKKTSEVRNGGIEGIVELKSQMDSVYEKMIGLLFRLESDYMR